MPGNHRLYSALKRVKAQQKAAAALSDEQLQAKTDEFKRRIEAGESLDALLPEAFAVVCEADKRILGLFPYDVQILGGIALHYGCLAEMNTGEGKTLTATMPLYLNALSGESVILVTANEYLARRDAEEMGPVYEFLGMTVGACLSESETQAAAKDSTNKAKRAIYACDITYTTHGALGFDYLLNNLVQRAEDRFMRDLNYVIVDEADAVLLDAACMPLVISGSPRVQSNLYELADFFVTTLVEDEDYEQDDKSIWLTKKGVAYAEHYFGIDRFYSAENFEINRHVTLALRAHFLSEKDQDYVVSDKGEIELLDKTTGRAMPGMKLRGGSHQALEVKEKVALTQENRSVASVTFQNLFMMFPKMAGMSGTIADAKRELRRVYKKKVVVIPPNKKMQRKDLPDVYLKNAEAQYGAAIEEILQRHATGQPVLVVTPSISDSELVSLVLVDKGVPHSVLNANNAYWEANMIKEAGQINAVTVSTGMAGRGTDIRLGEGVRELGGLAVVGVGRMASVRHERQARGRSGRQGDPGTSRFYVSLEDDVTEILEDKVLERYVEHDRPISQRKLRSLINAAQRNTEEQAVSQREHSVDYDKIMKRQRDIMYETRNGLLDGVCFDDEALWNMICKDIDSFLKSKWSIKSPDVTRFVLDNLSYNLDKEIVSTKRRSKRVLRKQLRAYAQRLLEQKRAMFDSDDGFRDFVRLCTLRAIDEGWVEQVDYLQQLQYVMSGRASTMRNPLFEYYGEAYGSFSNMVTTLRKETVRNVFLGSPRVTKKGKRYILFP